jgi:hypothetical protein
MQNFSEISKHLNEKGYVVIPNFLGEKDITPEMLDWLSEAQKFKDGVIQDIPEKFIAPAKAKIAQLIPELAKSIGIQIHPTSNAYSAIRLNRAEGEPILRLPFDVHRDPKISPGGVLNWHLDHYSYYLGGDHKNYFICYLPVKKPDIQNCNVAVLPYDTLKKLDPNSFEKTQHRGALRFRCVESDTKPWFEMRFPNEKIEIGQWFAIDDYYPTPGWKMSLDLEKEMAIPELAEKDLLIMRADVIHRTQNAKSDRISIRCDAIPQNSKDLNSWINLIAMYLKLPFDYPKVRYNRKIWLNKAFKQKWAEFRRSH